MTKDIRLSGDLSNTATLAAVVERERDNGFHPIPVKAEGVATFVSYTGLTKNKQ